MVTCLGLTELVTGRLVEKCVLYLLLPETYLERVRVLLSHGCPKVLVPEAVYISPSMPTIENAIQIASGDVGWIPARISRTCDRSVRRKMQIASFSMEIVIERDKGAMGPRLS